MVVVVLVLFTGGGGGGGGVGGGNVGRFNSRRGKVELEGFETLGYISQ